MKETRQSGRTSGFSLIEVLAALAILGTAAFVLLDAHHTSLGLFMMTEEEVDMRLFIEEAVAQAELGVYDGAFSGSGDFGPRYPDYAWAYDAVLTGEEDVVELYEVTVTVTGPDDERSLFFLVYNTGLVDTLDGGLSDSNQRSSSRNTSASGRTSSFGSR